MKKNYTINLKNFFLLSLLFSVHLVSFAQSKSQYRSSHPGSPINPNSHVLRNGTPPASNVFGTTDVVACNSYTWPVNGQTYTIGGTYTAPAGVTQSFNSLASWTNSATAEGATISSSNLNGIPQASPIDVTIGGVTVNFSSTGGMYSSGTFVGTNNPNVPLTIAFNQGVYGVSANYFLTNINDAAITGDITITYMNGANVLFADTRTVTNNTPVFGYTSTTPITSIVVSAAATTPAVNRYISIDNMALATNPDSNHTLNLTIEPGPVTTPYSICQNGTVSGGLVSTLGGASTSVEWYAAASGGSAIGTGSPFNPVGVAGSGLANTNTVGVTKFYAQFPGNTCRTAVDFTVTASPAATFDPVAPICVGETLSPLPTTSTNGISGTWSPALNNNNTTTYTFTPAAGQCGTSTTLEIVVKPLPQTSDFSVCLGSTVSGGLVSNIGGGVTPVPNFTGDTTGGPTFNRSTAMAVGGTCGASSVGLDVHYSAHTFVAPISGSYTFSLCGNASFDTFLALYQGTFNPAAGPCAGGNTLVTAVDDSCGSQSAVTANLVVGTTYILIVTGFDPTDVGAYTLVSTTPPSAGVAWYTSASGGSAIGTGSPFNPVGVAGSGIADTNTAVSVPFFAQFPGSTCRSLATFNVTPSSVSEPTGSSTQTFTVSQMSDATIASIDISPTNVIWYASLANAQSGTSPLASTTVLTNGATYYAVNTDGVCRSTPFAVTVTVTLGNGEFGGLNFAYYPNPTSSILNISHSEVISGLTVFNLLGQKMLHKNTDSNEVQIDLSSLPKANYFINVVSEGKTKVIKVLKQ